MSKPVPPEPLLVEQRQAERILSLSRRSLFNLRHSGQLPFVRLTPRGKVLYDMADLQAFVAKMKGVV